MRRDRLPHFPRRGDDLHRQVDDVGVGPQLLDGGDAVGVDGDQADAAFLAQAVMGGQLGDGGRLADAGRTDQGHQPASPGRERIGPATAISASIIRAMRALASSRSARLAAAALAADAFDQFAGQLLAQIGVDQFGEEAEQFLGQVAVPPPLERRHSSSPSPASRSVGPAPRRGPVRGSAGGGRRAAPRRGRPIAAAADSASAADGRPLGPRRRQPAGHVDARTRPSPRSAAGRGSQPNSRRVRTSRVCSTAASGPSSRRTIANASCIVAARYVLSSMASLHFRITD